MPSHAVFCFIGSQGCSSNPSRGMCATSANQNAIFFKGHVAHNFPLKELIRHMIRRTFLSYGISSPPSKNHSNRSFPCGQAAEMVVYLQYNPQICLSLGIGKIVIWPVPCDKALFVFLKFISSVVPTINYDFTMEIEF